MKNTEDTAETYAIYAPWYVTRAAWNEHYNLHIARQRNPEPKEFVVVYEFENYWSQIQEIIQSNTIMNDMFLGYRTFDTPGEMIYYKMKYPEAIIKEIT